MTIARSRLVDVTVSRWYHCISRCVRRAFLIGEGVDSSTGDRKEWIERRLKELAEIFAVSVGGFSIMDNHLHLLVRLDSAVGDGWSAVEVVRRWFVLYPPRGADRKALSGETLEELRAQRLGDAAWIAKTRERLKSLSWFMKCLKEPLSRLVNKAEKCTGAFFEGRFKSIMILDDEALLSVCAYIDLNPVAAGIAPTPEESEHTSIRERVVIVEEQGRTQDLEMAIEGSVPASKVSAGLEDKLWLVPIEDRRRIDSVREGMLAGFTLGNYLSLVEYTGRLIRDGKASISAELAGVFEQLGSNAEAWKARLMKLSGGRLLGRFLAANRQRLREVAERMGVHHLANLGGCRA